MELSDKLSYEIYIILIFHIPAIIILFSFCDYLYQKAKKSAVLYSFLALAAMLLIWMLAKVFKTVSPNQQLRWVFIVIQYFGIQFMGFCLIVFAYIYTRNRIPSLKALILLGILPTISFFIVLTNPIHMQFYSYYDFYKDRFGPLFLPIQSFQYLYLIIGIVMLSKNYTHQPGFEGRKQWARIFALVTLIPLCGNLYYILFKLDIFPWIFSIPVFDFSPIAGTASLILFTIPALHFRFFDISPVSHRQIFNQMPYGIVFVTQSGLLYSPNKAFIIHFIDKFSINCLEDLAKHSFSEEEGYQFLDFYHDHSKAGFLFKTNDGLSYQVSRKIVNRKSHLYSFSDITIIMDLRQKLLEKNMELTAVNEALKILSGKEIELTAARIKASVAQNIHDILGHSLTVALCTADLAENDTTIEAANEKLKIIYLLLVRSLEDLKNSVQGKPLPLQQTSLIIAIQELSNPNITLSFNTQGISYELNSARTEALFRVCQEAITNAIKHGQAKSIHIFLRYFPEKVELFIIDDGTGCKTIVKNYGLSGMESRILALQGTIDFGSDGIQGFHIHVKLENSFS